MAGPSASGTLCNLHGCNRPVCGTQASGLNLTQRAGSSEIRFPETPQVVPQILKFLKNSFWGINFELKRSRENRSSTKEAWCFTRPSHRIPLGPTGFVVVGVLLTCAHMDYFS